MSLGRQDLFHNNPFHAWRQGNRARPQPALCKTNCPEWKRINVERHKLFAPPRKPELSEAQKALPASSNGCEWQG